MLKPARRRISKSDDSRITRAIQTLTQTRGGYAVETLNADGESTGPRLHHIDGVGTETLALWVTVGRGFGEYRTFKDCGSVTATFVDGVLQAVA